MFATLVLEPKWATKRRRVRCSGHLTDASIEMCAFCLSARFVDVHSCFARAVVRREWPASDPRMIPPGSNELVLRPGFR